MNELQLVCADHWLIGYGIEIALNSVGNGLPWVITALWLGDNGWVEGFVWLRWKVARMGLKMRLRLGVIDVLEYWLPLF